MEQQKTIEYQLDQAFGIIMCMYSLPFFNYNISRNYMHPN